MDIQVQTTRKKKSKQQPAGRPAKEDNSTKGWVLFLVLSFIVYSRFQNV